MFHLSCLPQRPAIAWREGGIAKFEPAARVAEIAAGGETSHGHRPAVPASAPV